MVYGFLGACGRTRPYPLNHRSKLQGEVPQTEHSSSGSGQLTLNGLGGFKGHVLTFFSERSEMPKGNPNPNMSGLKPFKKGSCPNPGGKTKEQVAIERRNAQKAMEIREKILGVMAEKIDEFLGAEEASEKAKVLSFLEASALKMLKDAEDRGLGAPIQDVRSGDGSMTPKSMIDPTKMSEAALAELLNASTEEA